MSVISCKMCGGNLIVEEGSVIAECEYCGRKQTIPTVDDEKKLTLFARAGRLLRACEFDKAAGIFEAIVADFPEEAEAYWGLVLCRFGIEYVDDPATGSKVPTCHRSGFDSVMEDKDFEQACENAVPEARRLYREEAKQIEELRKAIIEVSGKEEPYDIFICYKETADNGQRTIDSVLAQDIYEKLTDAGYRVFFSRITLEDKLGTEYEPYIFAALNSAKIMLAFGTDYEHFNAVWVKNEWSRFLKLMEKDKSKRLIPCYRDIDAYDMPKEFAKLQAQDMGKVGADQDLIRAIKKLISKGDDKPEAPKTTPQVVQPVVNGGPSAESLLKRAYLFLEEGEFAQADEYFNKVIDIDPENDEAYIGLMLKDAKTTTRAAFEQGFIGGKFKESRAYDRAKKFAKGGNAAWFEKLELVRREAEERVEKMRREAEVNLKPVRERLMPAQKLVSAGGDHTGAHTVGLKADGTVVSAGRSHEGQCYVSDWRDIVAVSAGGTHTVALKADGTVVAGGSNSFWQCNVSDWRDIVAISAGSDYTVGLKADGTVVACGVSLFGQCNVSDWRDIVAVSAGSDHTVGLKADGTVVACGDNLYGQCNVSDWRDIVAVSAGRTHTVGLKADGTLVAVGYDHDGQCDVSDWRDIVAVSAGYDHTVGLKADGTVVACGDNSYGQYNVSGWRDIVAVSAGSDHTVGLKADGTVIAVGRTDGGRCNVSDWKLFDSFDKLEEERREAAERAEKERKEAAERAEKERMEAKERAEKERREAEERAEKERKEAAERAEKERKEAAERAELEEKERIEAAERAEMERKNLLNSLTKRKAEAEKELANLKGLFTGKRRKELEAELVELNKRIAALQKA